MVNQEYSIVDGLLGVTIGLTLRAFVFKKALLKRITVVSCFEYLVIKLILLLLFSLLSFGVEETGFPMGLGFFFLAVVPMSGIINYHTTRADLATLFAFNALLVACLQTALSWHPMIVNSVAWDITLMAAIAASLKNR